MHIREEQAARPSRRSRRESRGVRDADRSRSGHALRSEATPIVSLVAEDAGVIVGHIMFFASDGGDSYDKSRYHADADGPCPDGGDAGMAAARHCDRV